MRLLPPLLLPPLLTLAGPPPERPAAVFESNGIAFEGTAAVLAREATPFAEDAASPAFVTVPLLVVGGIGTGVRETAEAATEAGNWPDGRFTGGGRGPRASGARMTRTP